MALIGQFWGTSDAAGIPAPYCACPVCEEARREGGRNVRLRSCFRLSDEVMLDLGADSSVQAMRYGCIKDLDHLLITHTHEDHLNAHMLMQLVWDCGSRGKTLHYYLTGKAMEIIENWRNTPWILKGALRSFEDRGLVQFHALDYGQRIRVGEFYATPFRGNHPGNMGEDSAMYLMELPDGRKLFYGLDSGVFYPETVAALAEHRLDIFITEACLGTSSIKHPHHMSLQDAYELVCKLKEQGTLDENSTVYLTHINHGTSHKQMLAALEEMHFPVPTVIAYDGLKVFPEEENG